MQHLTALIFHITKTVIAVACLLSAWAATAHGKEWRGIVPLRSTRADVERLLGMPTMRPHESSYFYDLKDEIAVVWFETTGCDDTTPAGTCGWAWNVPIGTVTSIGVTYKRLPPVSDFVRGGGFREERACAGLTYYTHTGEGLELEADEGRVVGATYMHTAAESILDCPEMTPCPVAHFRKFDEYGNIRFADEKARLDNVAVELQSSPILRLAILAYGGRKGREGEAVRRAERARDYLVRVRRIKPWRIVAADCGYREDLTVELLPLGLGATRIYSSPTVDPHEVQIIPEKGARGRNRRQPRQR